MTRLRQVSEADIYHVVSRGTGKQLIYEDDDDRRVFLHLLRTSLSETGVELFAWCLMGNHFHLLLHGDITRISKCMQKLCSSYARWFNEKAGRVGHLFQDRFYSEPINSDSYLLTVVRYIHDNPEKGHIAPTNAYPWSSYREYVRKPRLCTTAFVLSVFGGQKAFCDFHEKPDTLDAYTEADEVRAEFRLMSDIDFVNAAQQIVKNVPLSNIKMLTKRQRNDCIRTLRKAGFSVRQIERLTGIGRNIIARAK